MFSMVKNQDHQWKSIIKLKIPKSEVKEDHDGDDNDQDIFGFEDEDHEGGTQKIKNNDSLSKICHVCNKGFSSGKALGGHMRIHVQAATNKEFIISGKKSKRLSQEGDMKEKCNNNIQEPTCSLCGKKFPSMKSLFGHMRCHPDRERRGIQPLTNNNINSTSASSSSDHQNDSVDLSKVIGGAGWSVTAKRSRKPINDYGTINSSLHLSRNSSSEEKQLCDAVHYLMLLAYGDPFKSGHTGSGYMKENPAYKIENDDADVISGTRRRTVEEMTQLQSNSCVNVGERNTVYPARKSVRMDNSDDEAGPNIKSEVQKQVNSRLYETTDKNTAMFVKMKSIKRRRKKMKLKHLGSLQDAASNPFPHQNAAQVTPDDINYRSSDSTNIVPMEGSTKEAVVSNSKLLESSIEYKSFNKIFSSKHTLGVHKLCEYRNSTMDDQPQLSSSQDSSLGEGTNTSGPRILDFDLNELPLPEDEAGSTNHACVSYSSF